MDHRPAPPAVSCVHRSMNERSQRLAPALAVSMRCECECHRTECGATFEITMRDYDAVRSDGHLFAVVAGHESPEETVVSSRRAYLVIEKSGDSGRSALLLDPRAA
jgi:hypothetical protein